MRKALHNFQAVFEYSVVRRTERQNLVPGFAVFIEGDRSCEVGFNSAVKPSFAVSHRQGDQCCIALGHICHRRLSDKPGLVKKISFSLPRDSCDGFLMVQIIGCHQYSRSIIITKKYERFSLHINFNEPVRLKFQLPTSQQYHPLTPGTQRNVSTVEIEADSLIDPSIEERSDQIRQTDNHVGRKQQRGDFPV